MSRAFPTLFVVLLIAACGGDDRDPGGLQTDPPDETDPVDMGEIDMPPDQQDPPDAGPEEMGSTEDPPQGEVCPDVMSEPFVGMCDPVRGEGCPSPDEECRLGAQLVGTETVLTAFCQADTPPDKAIHEDEPCRGDDIEGVCVEGLWCATVLDVCRPICYPDNGVGCDPGEFCRHPGNDWIGLGYCYDTCEL